MPIYFSLLARRQVVLCDHAEVSGNFESLAQSILRQLSHADNKISYESGQYLFHVMVSAGLTFLCVTEATFDRAVAFSFLTEVQQRLQTARLEEQAMLAGPYSLRSTFSPVLSELMDQFSRTDGLDNLQHRVKEVKGIMTENIEKVIRRGEAIEDLSERSEVLMQSSTQFRTYATRLRRQQCWKSVKLWACCIGILVALVVLAIVVAIIALAATGKFKKGN